MARIALFVFFISASVFASQKPFVRVRWKGGELRIAYKNKLMTYDYSDPNDGRSLFLYAIDKVTTDYLAEKDNVVYMILDVTGPSRGPESSMGQCGGGTEAAKILFAFNADGEIKPPQIVLYASCFQTLEAEMDNLPKPDSTHGNPVAKFEAYPPAPSGHLIFKSIVNYFNPEHPEAGITSTETCTDQEIAHTAKPTKDIPCP